MNEEDLRDQPIMQKCLGEGCSFLEDYSACIHKFQVDAEEFCTLACDNRIHTHEEIAKIMGITKQAVMYLEKKALDKMKRKMLEQLHDTGLEPNDIF